MRSVGDGGSTTAGTLKYLSEVVSGLWISSLARSFQEFDIFSHVVFVFNCNNSLRSYYNYAFTFFLSS